jgi:DNA-binding MarR family transcriptional regulator
MDETEILQQAKVIASRLPILLRQLFTLDDGVAGELPLAQLRVCGMLYGGPRAMSNLSRELGISLSAMTQIADRLERAELVKRVAEGSDRRIRCLQLTHHGEEVMQQREQARIEQVSAVLGHLSLPERHKVLATFELLTKACKAAKDKATLAAEVAP